MTKRAHGRTHDDTLAVFPCGVCFGGLFGIPAAITDAKLYICLVGARMGHGGAVAFAMQSRHIFVDFVFLI